APVAIGCAAPVRRVVLPVAVSATIDPIPTAGPIDVIDVIPVVVVINVDVDVVVSPAATVPPTSSPRGPDGQANTKANGGRCDVARRIYIGIIRIRRR